MQYQFLHARNHEVEWDVAEGTRYIQCYKHGKRHIHAAVEWLTFSRKEGERWFTDIKNINCKQIESLRRDSIEKVQTSNIHMAIIHTLTYGTVMRFANRAYNVIQRPITAQTQK